MKPIAVLVSGSGSNLQAILDAAGSMTGFGAEVVVVISDRPGAPALQRAAAADVPAEVVAWSDYENREAFTVAVCDTAARYGAEAMVLAGFMRILAPVAFERFPASIINIHPSLLPAFPGAHAVPQALAHGVRLSGVTIHFVDEEVDHGPIIVQEAVPVVAGDTEATLHARIQRVEHCLFPAVVDAFGRGLLEVDGTGGGAEESVVTRLPVRRALISVADKRGLVDLARRLVAAEVEIVSSGGTARTLAEAAVPHRTVADVTGSPEMLGGRVKTLHPRIHGGILADAGNPEHRADLERLEVDPFDLVVCNLYPFEETAARPDATDIEIIEQIDIGGPAMVRAAAKNHARVAVVTSPDDYDGVADAVAEGGLDDEMRLGLARAAFFHTAAYDAAIVDWMERDERPPARVVLPLERRFVARYGENPHQSGAVYTEAGKAGWWRAARLVQGKPMSFNNFADAEAAWRLVHEFALPAVVVIKHTNPCGVAEDTRLDAAFTAAWECDPLAAFGSVIACNRPLDAVTARLVGERFVEVLIAPEVLPEARAALEARADLRVLEAPGPGGDDWDLRRVELGILLQQRDRADVDRETWQVATSRRPTPEEWDALEFAWRVAAHTKSNAVVVARGRTAVGVGAGDQSRVGAAERAVHKAGDRAKGAVAAGDAFFPFRDGIDTLAAAGVAAIVQPGGSRRDDEVIAAADEHGITMVMTGRRHFRH